MNEPRIAPQELGRYAVVSRIGSGGMGEVHLAHDRELDRLVALKLAHVDPERPLRNSDFEARLRREARAMARVCHPNIIPIYDIGEALGRSYIVMELADCNLAEWISENDPDWCSVLRIYCQTAEGLSAAHKADLVHRDLKPQNILIDSRGCARVADFGMSTVVADRRKSGRPAQSVETDVHVGTLRYMAPEQHTGDPVGAAADQFSFCVALYEGLFGRHPFVHDDYPQLVCSVLEGRFEIPDCDDVPASVINAVCRGLSPAPARRHRSMQALFDRLTAHCR